MQNLPEQTVEQVRFLAASEKLRQYILTYKKPERHKFPYDEYRLCALERVAVARGTWFTVPVKSFLFGKAVTMYDRFQCDLRADAEALGFTTSEASGIMNGWDEAAGKRKVFSATGGFVKYDATAMERGEKLGREMYELSKERGLL